MRIIRCCLVPLFVCIPIWSGCAGPQWNMDATRAARLAARENRPVLVYYRSGVCRFCARMEREVFTNPEVLERLDDFVLLRRDFGLWREEAKNFGVTGTPGFVARRPNGTRIGAPVVGHMSAAEFRAFLAAARLQK